MSNFPRDLRQAAFDEVPLSVEEVAHGVWDGVIFGPRAWRVLGDRISTKADVMRRPCPVSGKSAVAWVPRHLCN